MKKMISVLLILCLVFSLTSVAVFAAPEDPAAEAAAEVITEAAAAEEAAAETAEEVTGEEAAAEETGEERSDVSSVFNSDPYVNANEAAGLDARVNVDLDLGGSTGTLYLPGGVDTSLLTLSWDDAGLKVTVDGTACESGTAPVPAAGEKITYKIKKNLALCYLTLKTVQGSEGVEPMFLQLDESLGTIEAMNSDEEHETSCYGSMVFDDRNDYILSMKGRGNSTWGWDKKPYNITFYKKADYDKKQKQELIPGVKAKKWSLLANHLDASLLRNKTALDLAKELGIGLDSRFVDLWMNGEYLGNYLITPKSDYKAPDGGYFLENDNYIDSEDYQFKLPGMFAIGDVINDDGYLNMISIKDIGDDAGVDNADVEAYVLDAWAALEDYDSEDYQKYFDLDSWAKMFLMYEVSKTYDCFAGSLLMHRDGLTEDDKLIAGPAWDYDVSFGRTLHKFLVGVSIPLQVTAEGWYNDGIGLMAADEPVSLLQELERHPSFMKAVIRVYNEYQDAFESVDDNVAAQADLLEASALMNNEKWGTHHLNAEYLIAPTTMHLLGTGKYALNYWITVNWRAYVHNLQEYCTKRVMWLSDQLCVETPAGYIVKKVHDDGVLLQTVLTAGTDSNSYQWQSSTDDGETWTDIEGATGATYEAEAEESLVRCVVTNAVKDIVTAHGGSVPTTASAVLAPAEIVVRLRNAEGGLQDGDLTIFMNGADMGEYTFACTEDGWTIQDENGQYLKASGKKLTRSDEPFAWTWSDGVFSAKTKVSLTSLGRALSIGTTKTVYLTSENGSLAVSTDAGTAPVFKEAIAG